MPRGDNNRKLSDEDRAEIVRLYTTPNPDGSWTGVTLIARQFQVRHATIDHALKLAGVQKRTASEAHAHGKRCKPIKNLPAPDERAPFCKCGCGHPVAWNHRRNLWEIYVKGHYHPRRIHHDPAWLTEQYVTRQRAAAEIAAEAGVAVSTILRLLKQSGVPTREPSEAHRGRQTGANNPAWKGGTTPLRQRLYKTSDWKALIKQIYERDNYTCQRCKRYRHSQNIKLRAHHIHSFAEHPELRFDPDNLVTLCQDCHAWVHSNQNITRDYLA